MWLAEVKAKVIRKDMKNITSKNWHHGAPPDAPATCGAAWREVCVCVCQEADRQR